MNHAKNELDRAVAALRAGEGAEQLSPDARARILGGIVRSEPRSTLPPITALFFPTWRWAWAGVAPVVLLTVALGIVAIPRGGQASAPLRVEARKLSGQVEFLIANGGTPHRVSKRSIPYRAASGTAIETRNGAFRDTLHSDETIVFYRID
jgi:hypothetical protein